MELQFRPVRFNEKEKIKELCKKNNLVYDYVFITRLLDNNSSLKSIVFGCFDRDRLIGLYVLLVYKLLFKGIVQDAGTVAYNIIDKPMRNKGIGIKIAEKLIENMVGLEIDLIFSFIEKKLVGKWSNAINRCWEENGFKSKEMPLIVPCFRPDKVNKKIKYNSDLSSIKATKLLGVEIERAVDYSNGFYKSFAIAELPSEQMICLAKQFPNAYHWFSIDVKDKNLGYLSCYRYSVHGKTKIQKQIIFNHLMIDDMYKPEAIDAVITELRKMGIKNEIYVIINSTVLNRDFYLKSQFYPGFSSFQPYIRCRPKKKAVNDAFKSIDNLKRFSLTVV